METLREPRALHLRTLGRLAVEAPGGTLGPAAHHRRRLAILALLALAGEQGLSRDVLIAYLWPEHDDAAARNALKQALHALRRDLGQPDLVVGGSVLRLNPAIVDADVWEFDRAHARADWQAAIEVYRGTLLDGVHLGGSAELEHWIDVRRERYARRFAEAVEAAAGALSARGDFRGAADCWHRLAGADPLNSRAALGLAHALARLGDAAAALRLAEAHGERVRGELGLPVDPELAALIEALRAGEWPRSGQATVPPSPADPPRLTERRGGVTASPLRRPWVWLTGAVTLTVILALAVATQHQPTIRREAWREVAVFPLAAPSDAAAHSLGEALGTLLAAVISGVGDLRSTDPARISTLLAQDSASQLELPRALRLARRLGARYFVRGEVVRVGSELQVAASLHDVDQGPEPLAATVVRGDTGAVLDIADRLGAELLVWASLPSYRGAGEIRQRFTASLPALRSYLDGEYLLRRSRYHEAMAAMQRAVRADSEMAIAWYRLSHAAEWAGRADVSRAAAAEAARWSERLSQYEGILAVANLAWRRGDVRAADSLFRHAAELKPTDVEPWYQLGEVWFHLNHLRGESPLAARSAFERVLELDPFNQEAIRHLARIAAREGRLRELRQLRERLRDLAVPDTLEVEALLAFARGPESAQDRVLRALATQTSNRVLDVLNSVAVGTRNLDGAARIARLLTEENRAADVRVVAAAELAALSIARGRLREAREILAPFRDAAPELWIMYRDFLESLPFLPGRGALPAPDDSAARTRQARFAAAVSTAVPPVASAGFGELRLLLRALLDLRRGDTANAASAVLTLHGLPANPDARRMAALVERRVAAELAFARHGARAGLAILAEPLADAWLEDYYSVFGTGGPEAYRRGEWLEAAGDAQEALAWFEASAGATIWNLMFVAPASLRRARILERLGRRREAATLCQVVLDLWRDADPEFNGAVAEAASRLERVGGR